MNGIFRVGIGEWQANTVLNWSQKMETKIDWSAAALFEDGGLLVADVKCFLARTGTQRPTNGQQVVKAIAQISKMVTPNW